MPQIRGAVLACAVVAGWAPAPASAQSLFESLFGFGQSRPLPQTQIPPRGVGAVLHEPVRLNDTGTDRHPERGSKDASGETFQTMCVRTCDGYYWPVRFPATRSDFKTDENVCTSTCGAQAKLYTRAGPGSEPEEMRDLDGNSYGASATAFAYRKKLINGCSCRPMPWSDGERARHEAYALAGAEKAIRLAQAEAERAAHSATAIQAAELANNPKPPVEMAQAEPDGQPPPPMSDNEDLAAPGPAEAAAIAAFIPLERSTAEALPRRTKSKRTASRERERQPPQRQYVQTPGGIVLVTPQQARRMQQRPPANRVYAASSNKWWLLQ